MNLCEPTIQNQELAEHVEAIRRLGKRVIGDVIEIGRHLTECQRIVGHGNWLQWLQDHFDFTDRHALNFMRVYELSLKSETVSDFDLSFRDLSRLAAPKAKPAADEIIARAEAGEPITRQTVAEVLPHKRGRVPCVRTELQKWAAREAMAQSLGLRTPGQALSERLSPILAHRSELPRIISALSDASKRGPWIDQVPADLVYEAAYLEAIAHRQQEFNEAMAARRGKKRKRSETGTFDRSRRR